VLEYKAIEGAEPMEIAGISLPAYQWRGILQPTTAAVLTGNAPEIGAMANELGKGKVWWLPTLTGLGSRVTDDYSALNRFLQSALDFTSFPIPFLFNEPQKLVLMKTMRSGSDLLTIVINKSAARREFALKTPAELLPEVLFTNKGGKIDNYLICIDPEETMVIKWH